MSTNTRLEPTIRKGRSADAATLSVLAMQVWLHTYATDGVSPLIADYILAELTPEKFRTLLEDPDVSLFVARRAENLLGYVVVRYNAECPEAGSDVNVETLYIQEHFTRSGIGTALLERACEEAEQRTGSRRIWLMVNVYNARAIAFYRKHGFEQVGTAYFELGEGRHENHLLVSPDA